MYLYLCVYSYIHTNTYIHIYIERYRYGDIYAFMPSESLTITTVVSNSHVLASKWLRMRIVAINSNVSGSNPLHITTMTNYVRNSNAVASLSLRNLKVTSSIGTLASDSSK